MKILGRRASSSVFVSLVCAAGLALGVSGASGGAEAMHVGVTGQDWASQLRVQQFERRAGASRRHEVWSGREKASDSRVSGRYRSEFDVWEYPDSRVHFTNMKYALSGPGGRWLGTPFGVRDSGGSHYIFGTHVGTGRYAGLQYRLFVHDKASGSAGSHLFDVDGWIEGATKRKPAPAATDEVHVRVTGTSRPASVLPLAGLAGGVEKTSDPRTSGRSRWSAYVKSYPDGRMHLWGEYWLANVHATWHGTWFAVVTRDRRYIRFVDALGEGVSEGLRYRHVGTGRYPRSNPRTITLAVDGWVESLK